MSRSKPGPVSPGQVVAVLTGDLIGSSKVPARTRSRLYSILDASLSPRCLRKVLPSDVLLRSQVFRGDAFQVLLGRPDGGLAAALHIIADLRSHGGDLGSPVGVRIAMGIGATDFVSIDVPLGSQGKSKSGTHAARASRGGALRGDGEAFRLSGRGLDGMKKNRQLVVCTRWPEVDAELDVGCRFLDGVIKEMTAIQASALRGALEGMTQREIADSEGKSQPAVAQRLRRLNWRAVRDLLVRFDALVDRFAAKP